MDQGKSKSHTILMVADDGSVYAVDPKEMRKVARKVPRESLSDAAKAHIDQNAGPSGSTAGISHIFAAKSDFLVASEADFLVASKADFLVSGGDED